MGGWARPLARCLLLGPRQPHAKDGRGAASSGPAVSPARVALPSDSVRDVSCALPGRSQSYAIRTDAAAPGHVSPVTLTAPRAPLHLDSLLNSREPRSRDSRAPPTPVVDLLAIGAHSILAPNPRDGRSGCCSEQTLPTLAVPSPATRHLQPNRGCRVRSGHSEPGGLRQTSLPSCGVNVPSWKPRVGVGGGLGPRAAQTHLLPTVLETGGPDARKTALWS